MRIRTVFVAAVLAAVAALPLAGVAALPFTGVASAGSVDRECQDVAGPAAACGDHVGRHRFLMTRLDVPRLGDGSTVPSHGSTAAHEARTTPGDAGALVLAGLGAVAALGAAYGVVRRSPSRPRARSRRLTPP
ncbi:MAG: hypothetical protein QOK35_2393 [Pseudonocardiales bacterium]|nr:hypothetical protein [Pseudonocardiales bacterium]